MDETTRGHTTTFTRAARTRRMLDRLSQGWGYRDVASAEGLSERRVRQIVGEHVKRRQPVDEETHAALQVERLGFAVKIAGEALAKGDIRAIAPFIKAIDRLDAYQARARKAAPPPQPSREADALVMKSLVDRIRRGVEAEAAARSPDPGAAPEPVIETQPSPPPIEPESPLPPAAPPLAAAEPALSLAGPDGPLAAAPPVALAEPAPPLAGPDGPLAVAAPPVALAEPSPALAVAAPPVAAAEPAPPLAGPQGPLDLAARLAIEAELTPPAPPPVAAPFARPDMSNFAFSNYSPIFWR